MAEKELRVAMQRNLRAFDRTESAASLTPAAVAIVVLLSKGVPTVPIFQRPLTMSQHAGQMALPGGKLHAGETVEECATRELREELGLVVDRGDVIGMLDDFDTRSGFTITPVVIWSGAEVAELRLSASEVHELYLIGVPELRGAVASCGSGTAFSLKFTRMEVFAPTAAMLYQFSEVALDGRSTRVADFHQPRFTHR